MHLSGPIRSFIERIAMLPNAAMMKMHRPQPTTHPAPPTSYIVERHAYATNANEVRGKSPARRKKKRKTKRYKTPAQVIQVVTVCTICSSPRSSQHPPPSPSRQSTLNYCPSTATHSVRHHDLGRWDSLLWRRGAQSSALRGRVLLALDCYC